MSKMTFETPKAMRARIYKDAGSEVGKRTDDADGGIIKRIAQPYLKKEGLLDHINELRAWLAEWRTEENQADGMSLQTTRKVVNGMGLVMPSSLRFESLSAYTEWLGVASDYRVAVRRISQLADIDPRLESMNMAWQLVATLPDPDFLSFMELVSWRIDNPFDRPSVRSLVIEGLDTKWIENHKPLLRATFRLIKAYDETAESEIERLGFSAMDRMTVWFRGRETGGLLNLTPQVALRPSETHFEQFPSTRRIFIIENLTSYESIEMSPGDLVIWGQGNQAPAALAAMGWITEQQVEIYYWGDMDSEGYRILSRVRSICPAIRSLSMGSSDLKTYAPGREVCVPTETRAMQDPACLTDDELTAFKAVSKGSRIEQEKLPHKSTEDILCAKQKNIHL